MKNIAKKILALLIAAVFVIPALPAGAAAPTEDCYFYMTPEDNASLPFTVGSYEKGNTQSFLFLPNSVDQTVVTVRSQIPLTAASGDALVDWNAAEGTVTVDTSVENYVYVNNNRVIIFMTASLPSVSVTINEGESLSTIHADKNAKIGAKVRIDGAGEYDFPETDIQIKTRGYTSFQAPKKPYQIKFDKKQNLFGMGKAKKWILLANYYDGTMVRTKLFFDLADEIGMDYVSKSVFVDLYIDGDYKGVYQLIEKIEVGSTRVDLTDEAGVVLEMECNPRLEPDDINFITDLTEKAFVYKDYVYDFEDESTPERVQRINEIKAMVEEKINAFESAIYADEPDWDTISSMIDVDSFIKYYFLNEYGEQVDCTFSSTYFYIDGPDDVIHCGPIWDFDRCCGFSYVLGGDTDFMKNIIENTDSYRVGWFKELFRNPEFTKRAGEIYDETVKAAFDTDKVNAQIDSYQTPMMPSLWMNYMKWPVLFDNDYTADYYAGDDLDAQIAYTTNSVKNFLADKKPYLDTAYGADMPTILYTTYTTVGNARKTYSGGEISQQGAIGGIKVELVDSIFDGGLIYRLKSNDDNLTDVSNEGEINHASDGYKRAKAIFIKPEGNFANYFTVQYRIHYNGVWGAWTENGHCAGIPNNYGYIDQIQVRLIKNKEVEFSNVIYVAEGFDTVTERGVVGNVFTVGHDLEKNGFRFTGWYVDEDRTIPADGEFVLESGDHTLYAGFEEIPYLAGDVNGDGCVNLKDVSALRALVAGSPNAAGYSGDVNGDGSVNLKDIKALKGIIV